MGSYGAGFTLNEGVVATASIANKNEIVFNNKPINFPTVASLIKKLTNGKIKIKIKTTLPLGCGFGLSGASAIASSYAVNHLLNLRKSNKELAIMSHIAEVENKTGLGDVVNQFYGGFCMKLKPSSHFVIERLPINNDDVYCRYFSKISTKSIITNPNLKDNINNSASAALDEVQGLMKQNKKIKFSDIIKISKAFAVNSGLLKDKRTIEAIAKIERNNGNASMIMLGNAVFSDKNFHGTKRFKISNIGAHLL